MIDATGQSSDRASRRNGGKVLLGIEHVVEKVRQGVHGHKRDDLHDVRIRVAGIADSFQIDVTDLATGLDDFARQLDGGVPLRVAGMALPSENDFIGRQLGHMLGRKAVKSGRSCSHLLRRQRGRCCHASSRRAPCSRSRAGRPMS